MPPPFGERVPDFVPPGRANERRQAPASNNNNNNNTPPFNYHKLMEGTRAAGGSVHTDPSPASDAPQAASGARPPAPGGRRGSNVPSGSGSPRAGSAGAGGRRHSSVFGGGGKGGGEFFRVFLRIRPYLELEKDALRAAKLDETRSAVELTQEGELLLLDEKCLSTTTTAPYNEKKRLKVADHFSEAFWSFGEDPPKRWDDDIPHQNRSQTYVFRTLNTFNDTTIVHRLYEGYNHCIMTYGAMNAGKTHTMFGDAKDPGLASRFLEKVAARSFKVEQKFSEENMEVRLEVSLVRVWKENVEDLLLKDSGVPASEYTFKSMSDIDGITTTKCRSEAELQSFIAKVHKYRRPSAKTEFTKDNRSHVILTLVVQQLSKFSTPEGGDSHSLAVNHTKKSTLTLVDIGTAGRAEGETAQDGKLISMAPQAMTRVLTCLASRSTIPHRDSLLTQLLQEELGGNCNTTVVGCVAPFPKQYNDTVLTLDTIKRLQAVTSRVVKSESKELTAFRELANEKHIVKKQIQKQSSSMQKVRDMLTSLQLQLNEKGALNTTLHDEMKETQARYATVEEVRKRQANTLKCMKRYRKVLIPKFDIELRSLRTKKTEYKQKTQHLLGNLEARVDLERYRSEKVWQFLYYTHSLLRQSLQ